MADDSKTKRLLTVAEAADELNVGVRMVRRLVGDGRLPCHKIGSHVRISQSDLDEYIRSSRAA